jgi:hypothetical protein
LPYLPIRRPILKARKGRRGDIERPTFLARFAPDKDVQPLFGAAPKQTFRRRARPTGAGGLQTLLLRPSTSGMATEGDLQMQR